MVGMIAMSMLLAGCTAGTDDGTGDGLSTSGTTTDGTGSATNSTTSESNSTSTVSSNTTTSGPTGNQTGNSTGNQTGNATGNQTGNATGNSTSEPPVAEEFSCTVDVPAVVVSISGLPMAVGECEFVETETDTLLVLVDPAGGCTIRLDEDPSDTASGGVVQEGSINPPGVYTMRCDVQGPSVGGEGTIAIAPVAAA